MVVEVRQLLTRLEQSGCSFNRNGTWYNGPEAKSHLQRKYDYLVKRNLVNSSEQFIERGASRSSFSGRAYTVRCGEQVEESRSYLLRMLQRIRSGEFSAKP